MGPTGHDTSSSRSVSTKVFAALVCATADPLPSAAAPAPASTPRRVIDGSLLSDIASLPQNFVVASLADSGRACCRYGVVIYPDNSRIRLYPHRVVAKKLRTGTCIVARGHRSVHQCLNAARDLGVKRLQLLLHVMGINSHESLGESAGAGQEAASRKSGYDGGRDPGQARS